jgi:hypothetical protein
VSTSGLVYDRALFSDSSFTLSKLALIFVDIAFHRRGPEALPESRFLFSLVLVAYLTVSLLALQINWDLGQAVGPLLADVTFCVAFFWFLLQTARRGGRFWQTVTALLGAETFLSLIALPLLVLRSAAAGNEAFEPMTILLLTVVLLWSIDVGGFILSRALEQSYVVGVFIMVGYVISSFMLGEYFFPTVE